VTSQTATVLVRSSRCKRSQATVIYFASDRSARADVPLNRSTRVHLCVFAKLLLPAWEVERRLKINHIGVHGVIGVFVTHVVSGFSIFEAVNGVLTEYAKNKREAKRLYIRTEFRPFPHFSVLMENRNHKVALRYLRQDSQTATQALMFKPQVCHAGMERSPLSRPALCHVNVV
jgi:hypothetical protein